MDSFETQYEAALRVIRHQGDRRTNRTNTEACSMFDIGFRINVESAYPILTGKFIDVNIVNAEFEWFTTGQTTTKLFKDRGIKIWDAWADESGNLGPVYGHQMVSFNGDPGCNQLTALVRSINEEPFHRRHIVSLWNPQQLKEMALPPCYLYFQFYVTNDKKLNMFVVQRSGDMFGGVPYDVCLFTNLLIWIARLTRLEPNVISHRIVDAHIYTDHLDGVHEYLRRPTHNPPHWQADLFGCVTLPDYKHEPRIKINIAK